MMVPYFELTAIVLCLGMVILLSTVEAAVTQSNPLALRMLIERKDIPQPDLVSMALEDRIHLLLPLHFGTQAAFIAVVVLTVHLCLLNWPSWGVVWAFGIVFALSLVFRQLLPRLVTLNDPERKLVALLHWIHPLYHVLSSLAFPLSSILRLSRRLHQETLPATAEEAEAEASEEEIQAYLDIGEDEGILEEEDSELIQSVVQFGDTLVREVMTPRTRIVACSEDATIAELRDTMVNSRHSRIPIYREGIDHVIGVAYIRQLLAQYSRGNESDPITGLIQPALFVPEFKRVSALLKELQEQGTHLAVVIDEFGGVAGLVTIEDLVEEIVGEIRDEDQAKASDIAEEEPGIYSLAGSLELDRLEELTGRKIEAEGYSTLGGVVTAHLGRVPARGEEFDLQGWKMKILDADRKRVRRVRLHLSGNQPAGSEPGPA
jgi:magnesium and cobalt exporter, CNNM family